ncbi:hypothetical protein DL98DRAFT_650301 [Cadophora sp. DSE1049]|nr:hypothetical protein DL98DRAFT_650301 [Cadophora sp. DSE1049]
MDDSVMSQEAESATIQSFDDIQAQRRKHRLPAIDSRYWRAFIYEQVCGEVPVYYQDLGRQNEEVHPFHKDPYTLHAITIESFNGRYMEIMADVRNSAGNHLPGTVNLLRPTETTEIGVMITIVCKDTKRDTENQGPWDTATNKYMLVTAQPRISAGQLEFLELPTGRLDTNGKLRGIGVWDKIEQLLPQSPSRVLNMSEVAISGSHPGCPGLLPAGTYALGIGQLPFFPDGELRGTIRYKNTYEHTQIMLFEYRLSKEDFESLEKRVRNGYMDHRGVKDLPDDGSTLRLIRMRNMPWACAKDFSITLAWALYNNLESTRRIGYGFCG